VTYHGVRPSGYVSSDAMLDGSLVSAESLRAQLRLLKARYHVISPERFFLWVLGEEQLPPLALLLTCDDGLQNVLTDMLPILQEEKVFCLFFVTGASVGEAPSMLWYEELYLAIKTAPRGPISIDEAGLRVGCPEDAGRRAFWWQLVQALSERDAPARLSVLRALRGKWGVDEGWTERLRENPLTFRRFFVMTVQDLRRLAAQGMSIGAHTLHHPMLSRASDVCAQAEIERSRELLADALGQEVWAFAYPFGNPGSFTVRDLALAEAAKFSCAFANSGGGFGANLPRFALPRVHVTADMNLGEFEAHLSGFYRNLRGTPPVIAAADEAA
jgi:peptidoglycan/xylan/chitin deacetylase (PgdA/CDA1 family)